MKKNKGGHISLEQAMRMMQEENVILIDVKSKEEYLRFHLRGSMNIPIENFKKVAPRMIKDKEQKVILYCSSGIRSLAAYELLQDLGYTNVFNVYGGTD
ncbi:MAG: rhodanese-like domain-containing protein [Clostridia bacterium]|nr:rhodanese-like domain-containing protein [Clostridia bacterium]